MDIAETSHLCLRGYSFRSLDEAVIALSHFIFATVKEICESLNLDLIDMAR